MSLEQVRRDFCLAPRLALVSADAIRIRFSFSWTLSAGMRNLLADASIITRTVSPTTAICVSKFMKGKEERRAHFERVKFCFPV